MLKYRKNKVPDLGKHLNVLSLQNYVPLYKRFFSLNSTNWNSINLDNPVLELSVRDDSLYCNDTPLFFKFSPLLDPLKYLTGSYEDYDFSMPTPVKSYPPIDDFNNASYVDSFFSFLSFIESLDRANQRKCCAFGSNTFVENTEVKEEEEEEENE